MPGFEILTENCPQSLVFNNSVKLATLLDEVWGYDSNEDVRMLRVHVGGLRNKIEPDTKKPKYLHTVTNVGYKLTPFGEN